MQSKIVENIFIGSCLCEDLKTQLLELLDRGHAGPAADPRNFIVEGFTFNSVSYF